MEAYREIDAEYFREMDIELYVEEFIEKYGEEPSWKSCDRYPDCCRCKIKTRCRTT
jgi:hypothetical protein